MDTNVFITKANIWTTNMHYNEEFDTKILILIRVINIINTKSFYVRVFIFDRGENDIVPRTRRKLKAQYLAQSYSRPQLQARWGPNAGSPLRPGSIAFQLGFCCPTISTQRCRVYYLSR